MEEYDEVVIIGAGICGLATALALHKKGIKSIVMERSESLRNVTGAAIGIRPNGWRALDQLGVADVLRHTAVPIKRDREISLDGGRQKEISSSPWNGETRCLRRKDLIDALYVALPQGTVKFGCQLESIKFDQNSTKPVLRFIDGSSLIAKVVIGCDGSNSVVANFLDLKPTRMFPSCAFRGLTNYPNGHSFDHDQFARFWKNNILVGIIPIDDNSVYWFCLLPSIPKDEKVWEDPEVLRQSTLELLSDHPQKIREMIEKTDMKSLSFARLRYRAPWELLTSTFCKGTVTVAGDAMHVMGPFLGQGGSAGLEDAVVLARIMAQAGLEDGGESGSKVTIRGVEEAFNRFIKQRRMRLIRLSSQTYVTGMLWATSSLVKKIVYIVLLIIFFHNKNGHTDYDCGHL